jgi:hypothetical protein
MTQHVAGVDHRQAAATVTFCMIPRADPARRKCLFIVNRTEKRRYFSTPANLIIGRASHLSRRSQPGTPTPYGDAAIE